ncbi:MAG: CerR family C-terminal domain-containing protein [Sphingobium sp.]
MASESILDVAIRQFGDRGFEGASTRAIAAEAGTVMSSITYHYGGKKGLYLACADHIAASICERLSPVLDTIPPASELDTKDAIATIRKLMQAMGRVMLSEDTHDWVQFVIREQQKPGPAFDRIYSGLMERVLAILTGLLRAAQPGITRETVRAMAISLVAQPLVLRSAHATILRVFETRALANEHKALLLSMIDQNTEAILRNEQS